MNAPAPHSARAHASLPPSGAHRWMECSGSIRLAEGIPDRSSVYADEGTAAHEIAAKCLDGGLDPAEFLGSTVDIADGAVRAVEPDPSKGLFEVDDEMVDAVRLYVETVGKFAGKDDELDVEQRLDMRHIHKQIFGTGDAVLYKPAEKWLHVFDFKYGKGVAVDPDENPQLLLYGAGAARRFHNRPLIGITLHIVQPRAPHPKGPVRSWETDPLDLMEFESTVQVAAKKTEDPKAERFPGEWCRFCKAAPICPELRTRNKALAMQEFGEAPAAPDALSPERIGEVLKEADMIGNWVKAVQEFAHAQAVAGNTPAGFKLVAKRATRRWKDEEETKAALINDFDLDEADLYVDPKMKSPAQIEKVLGKKRFGDIEGMVVKESSGTNLVPEGDPRPAVKADALAEFGGAA